MRETEALPFARVLVIYVVMVSSMNEKKEGM